MEQSFSLGKTRLVFEMKENIWKYKQIKLKPLLTWFKSTVLDVFKPRLLNTSAQL